MYVVISMGSNLMYPSLTSLVSEAVGEDMVGEALGAINGVKALTVAFVCLSYVLLVLVSLSYTSPSHTRFPISLISLSPVINRGPGTTLLRRAHDRL